MAAVKLSYFNFSGGRGEDCRLALHMAGVPFEDDRIDPKDWPAQKASTPFGGIPVLEIEGEGVLSQSNAILGLIGTRHGLLPENDFEAARHRAVLNAVEDLRCVVNRTSLIPEEERKSAREEVARGYMRSWAEDLEMQIRGPFVGGDQISVADLKVFVVVGSYKRGTLDHFPTDYFDSHEKISGLYDAVMRHPKVATWYGEH